MDASAGSVGEEKKDCEADGFAVAVVVVVVVVCMVCRIVLASTVVHLFWCPSLAEENVCAASTFSISSCASSGFHSEEGRCAIASE